MYINNSSRLFKNVSKINISISQPNTDKQQPIIETFVYTMTDEEIISPSPSPYSFNYMDIVNFVFFLFNYGLFYPLVIYFIDFVCICIVGMKARWFQIHAIVNAIVVIHILPDVCAIYSDPTTGYSVVKNHIPSQYILWLHLYHVVMFVNLSFSDYLHHIVFVCFGVLPTMLFVKSNQSHLAYIACNGITGVVEYLSLALCKNGQMTNFTQKRLNSALYIYVRLPLCIIGVAFNYCAYRQGYIAMDNVYLTVYLNLLLFLNGVVFTEMTAQSYYKLKYGVLIGAKER